MFTGYEKYKNFTALSAARFIFIYSWYHLLRQTFPNIKFSMKASSLKNNSVIINTALRGNLDKRYYKSIGIYSAIIGITRKYCICKLNNFNLI